MRLIVAFSLFLLFTSISVTAYSQEEPVIDGGKYVLHTVAKKETIFNLCQKYNISLKELQSANPGLGAVLQAGSKVKIPVIKATSEPPKKETPAAQSAEKEYYYHKVGKKQTIFSIARQYGITADDVIRYNPEATKGLEVGQVLKIPVAPANAAENTKSADVSTYSVHPVVSGETILGLERRYGMSSEELQKWNPELKNGLKTGMKLKIPATREIQPETAAKTNQAFSKYQVGKGETLFSLASRFGVDVSELKAANPSLFSRSLEAGEILLIPQHKNVGNTSNQEEVVKQTANQITAIQENATPTNCMPVKDTSRKYKAALLLPFYLPEVNNGTNKSLLVSPIVFKNQPVPASTDTSIVINGTNIDPRATGFLEFYEGTLLAIDSLRRAGMNIELYVFDASNQQQVNDLVQMDEFRDLNLIIGPVYPELQEIVAGFAAKNRIPMISPLSSAGKFELNNSWYFKVSSTRDYQIDQTASYIAGEFMNRNFFLLQQSGGGSGSAEARLAALCKEKLSPKTGKNLFHEYNFQQQGVNDIEPLLDKTGENIFLIPTDNEAQVSMAVSNLNALAENYNIVLMGTTALTKMKSIQTENLHRVRLRFLSPYFVDYSKPLVRRFIGEYRDKFSGEPSPFSFQGFDVSYYFMSALFRYGRDFRNCIPDYPMELTQMNFGFRRVTPMGGYTNERLFITAYDRNFDILNYGTYDSQKSR